MSECCVVLCAVLYYETFGDTRALKKHLRRFCPLFKQYIRRSIEQKLFFLPAIVVQVSSIELCHFSTYLEIYHTQHKLVSSSHDLYVYSYTQYDIEVLIIIVKVKCSPYNRPRRPRG